MVACSNQLLHVEFQSSSPLYHTNACKARYCFQEGLSRPLAAPNERQEGLLLPSALPPWRTCIHGKNTKHNELSVKIPLAETAMKMAGGNGDENGIWQKGICYIITKQNHVSKGKEN